MPKNTYDAGAFGTLPVIAGLPKVTSLKDDETIASAIGALGGRVERMLCMVSFYFCRMARDKNADKGKGYDFGPAYEGYYVSLYTANGKKLLPGAKDGQKSWARSFGNIAKLPYETAALTEFVFGLPGVTMPQKGTILRKVAEKFADKVPTADDLNALVAKHGGKKADGSGSTIKSATAGLKASIKSLRDNATLFAEIEGNKECLRRFRDAETAITMLAEMAETVHGKLHPKPTAEEKKAAKEKPVRVGKAEKALIAAAAKALQTATMPKGTKAN